MSLFYKLLAAVLVAAGVVITYDLFQAKVERGSGEPRIRFDPETGRFAFYKPDIRVRIVYASMFGPGEPVMRVRDLWISRFEEEYSDRLAERQRVSIPEDEKRRFVARTLRRAKPAIKYARDTLKRIAGLTDPGDRQQAVKELESWLAGKGLLLMPLDARADVEAQHQALKKLVAALEGLLAEKDPAAKAEVLPRLVEVERRWQGRWVLTANRPRFLTGREVPDIIVGSKMELFALVQDDYAVAMDEPLPGEQAAPLDCPDTWGDPKRTWREAFIPSMLEEGVYTFLEDKTRADKVYMVPLRCTTFPIFYNEVLFQEAGIREVPRTWPEFIDVCEKLKAAGIIPLTADADVYSNMWQTWLTFRVLGPEGWETTICGVPGRAGEAAAPESVPPLRERYPLLIGGLVGGCVVPLGALVYFLLWRQRRSIALLIVCAGAVPAGVGVFAWRMLASAAMPSAGEARVSSPRWIDARHKAVYSSIRELRERGYFHKDFAGYKWPAAQRGFARGSAAMMICGSWLYQELGGYRDIASADVFRLSCFTFPAWPAGPDMSPEDRAAHDVRQRAFWGGISGLMVCKQGQATPHAIELVRYLSAKDHPYLVHWNGLISCMKDADFPPALKSIEAQFKSAPAIYSRAPNIYARRYASQVLQDRYIDFFMIPKGKAAYVTVEEFLKDLDRETTKYLQRGGEEYYE